MNLRLVFAAHEVLIHAGQALRRIETVMQRMELSLLAKLPSSQRALITEGQPVILEIVVTEAKRIPRNRLNESLRQFEKYIFAGSPIPSVISNLANEGISMLLSSWIYGGAGICSTSQKNHEQIPSSRPEKTPNPRF